MTPRARRLAPGRCGRTDGDKIHCLRGRIKDDLGFTAVELAHDVRDFLFERKLFRAVVGALAQYEGFDDGSHQVCAECSVRNHDRIARFVIQVRDFP